MEPDLHRVQNLGQLLRDSFLTYKSNPALIEADRHRENRRLSYLEALVEAETLAARMAGNLKAGERCAILMSNQSRWITGAAGAFFCGAVLVPLDYKLTAEEQLALIKHSSPQVLIVEYPIYRDLIRGGSERALEGVFVVVSDVPESTHIEAGVRFPDGDVSVAESCPHVPRQRHDLATIVYSSGTGGPPKGCMLTHDNYLEQAQVLARMFPMAERDRYLSVLPTNHAIDFMCGGVIPYLYGAAVVHQRTLRAEFLGPTMKRYRVTHTALVPRILKTLRERIEEQLAELPEWKHTLIRGLIELNEVATLRGPNHALSKRILYPIQSKLGGHLKMIFAGGSYVDPDLANYFYRLGFPVVIGYGLTEACTVLSVNDLNPFRANTVGRPVDGVEIEIRSAASDGVGEVFARGRTVMSGYWEDPEQSADVLVDGWLKTGDMGKLDASGHLQLVGRLKNMVVTEGGKNVYPEDVEGAFESLVCEELCVFAESFVWPDGDDALAGGLTLVMRPKEGQSSDAMVDAARQCNLGLKDYKRVRSYLVVQEAFPVTASQKIKRLMLADSIRASGVCSRTLMDTQS